MTKEELKRRQERAEWMEAHRIRGMAFLMVFMGVFRFVDLIKYALEGKSWWWLLGIGVVSFFGVMLYAILVMVGMIVVLRLWARMPLRISGKSQAEKNRGELNTRLVIKYRFQKHWDWIMVRFWGVVSDALRMEQATAVALKVTRTALDNTYIRAMEIPFGPNEPVLKVVEVDYNDNMVIMKVLVGGNFGEKKIRELIQDRMYYDYVVQDRRAVQVRRKGDEYMVWVPMNV